MTGTGKNGYWQQRQDQKEYSCGYYAGQTSFRNDDRERYTKIAKSQGKSQPWERGFLRGWEAEKNLKSSMG